MMSKKEKKKREIDLDEVEIIYKFTDAEGKKRKFKLAPSLGIRELITARGKKYIQLLLEEVEE